MTGGEALAAAYYQRHEAFDPVEAAEIRSLLSDRSPTKAAAASGAMS